MRANKTLVLWQLLHDIRTFGISASLRVGRSNNGYCIRADANDKGQKI